MQAESQARMCVHAMNAPDSRLVNLQAPLNADGRHSQLALLRVLAQNSELSQRELSRSLGLSLGKTHYVLHALLDKGLVKARNFTRSDNKLGYAYFLTPAGFSEKVRMTREFLARKEQEFEQLKTTIATLREEVTGEAVAPDAIDDGNRLATAKTDPTTPAPKKNDGRHE